MINFKFSSYIMFVFFNKTGNNNNYIASSNFFSVINRLKPYFKDKYFIIDPYLGYNELLITSQDMFISYYNNIFLFTKIFENNYKEILGKDIKYLVVYVEWWNESLKEAIIFSKFLKSKFKDIKIIYYGAFVNGYSNEILNFYGDFIDYIVKNEAEDIIEDIVSGKVFYDKIIEGNNYRKSTDFLDFHDYSISKNYFIGKTVEFEFSRGCIVDRCFFCMCTLGKKLRLKTINNHILDLNKLLYNGINKFYHVDAEVNSLKSYMYFFLNEYIEIRKTYDFIWSAYLIPKNISYEDLVLLYNAGCRHIRIGFESATQSRLDTIAKRTKLVEMIDIIRNAKKAGIIVQLHCIVGYPYEKEEELVNILNFIRENYEYIDIMNFYQFKPRRTTFSYDKPSDYNIEIIEEKINEFTLPYMVDNMYYIEKNNDIYFMKINNKNKLKIILLNKFIHKYGIKDIDPKTYFIKYN